MTRIISQIRKSLSCDKHSIVNRTAFKQRRSTTEGNNNCCTNKTHSEQVTQCTCSGKKDRKSAQTWPRVWPWAGLELVLRLIHNQAKHDQWVCKYVVSNWSRLGPDLAPVESGDGPKDGPGWSKIWSGIRSLTGPGSIRGWPVVVPWMTKRSEFRILILIPSNATFNWCNWLQSNWWLICSIIAIHDSSITYYSPSKG